MEFSLVPFLFVFHIIDIPIFYFINNDFLFICRILLIVKPKYLGCTYDCRWFVYRTVFWTRRKEWSSHDFYPIHNR